MMEETIKRLSSRSVRTNMFRSNDSNWLTQPKGTKAIATPQKPVKSVFHKDDSAWLTNTRNLSDAKHGALDQTATKELVKPLGQILAEITLGKESDSKTRERIVSDEEIEKYRALEKDKLKALDYYEQQHIKNSEIVGLIKQYRSIENYKKQFEKYGENDIKSWALQRAATASLAEFLAILYQATLLKDKQYLRDTQILSVLIFLNTEKGKGRLCQISTGEGKTSIVALLAIIKASRGEFVDILTSNPVLAQEGVDQKSPLYQLFNITVNTNNPDEKNDYTKGPKDCYKAKVVYGCISNFQFDYLRDTFEGLETRGGRPFGAAILDEVDSIVIDNGGHIAKLSGALPGMEYFRYIYVNIWEALSKLEGSNTEAIKSTLLQLKNNFIPKELIPGYLTDYANQSLDRWINNAIYAKYHCHENKQYVIKEKEGEKVVTPVDYSNTGVTLNETIWSHGLHQFLQLKHSLYLAPESLTSSFISNLGYVNKYNNNLYGLTGTLGSVNEQSLLSKIYHVEYARIPTFKNKRFTETQGIVANDTEWRETIVAAICHKVINDNRGVLVIVETIADAINIESDVNNAFVNYFKTNKVTVKKYIDEEIAQAHDVKVDSNHVIISTNIAGRGTDLSTTDALEKNGGLHVIVGFLPKNKRVEDQAFGRTARQGKLGTAQLVIRRSEAMGNVNSMETIKKARDVAEQARIQEISDKKISDLQFDDAIFSLFSTLYSNFKKANENDAGSYFLCCDLKEWWALFLESQDKKDKKNLNVANSFGEFLNSQKTQKIIKNKNVSHNPYYGIRLAEHLIKNGHYDDAKKNLDNALNVAGSNKDLLYSLYLKYFDICIEGGNAIQDRINRAIGDVFMLSHVKNDSYKEDAKKYLLLAQAGIQKEIDYVNTEKNKNPFIAHFGRRFVVLDVFENNIQQLFDQLTGKTKEDGHFDVSNDQLNSNEQYSVEIQGIHSTIKQVRSLDDVNQATREVVTRKLSAHMSQGEIDKLWKNVKESIKGNGLSRSSRTVSEDGFVIASRMSDYFDHLDEMDSNQKKLKEIASKKVVDELLVIGLENVYGLKRIHDVASYAVNIAKAEMVSGITLQAAAIAVQAIPVVSASYKALDTVAGLLISESICGIVSEILNGKDKFDIQEYWKNKGISYSVSASLAVLGGIAAMANSSKFVAKVKANFIEKMNKFFKNTGLAKRLQFKVPPKLPAAAIPIKPPAFSNPLFGKIMAGGQSAALDQLTEKAIMPVISDIFKSLKPIIGQRVREALALHLNKQYLQFVSKELINQSSEETIKKSDTNAKEMGNQIIHGIGIGSLQALKTNNWKVNLGGYVLGLFTNNAIVLSEITNYAKHYCVTLNGILKNKNHDHQNDVNHILTMLCEPVTEKIYGIIVQIITNVLKEGVVDPTVKNGPHRSTIPAPSKKTENGIKHQSPPTLPRSRSLSDLKHPTKIAIHPHSTKTINEKINRRHSATHIDTINGRRDISLLKMGAAGQVQLAMLAGAHGHDYIKFTVQDRQGKSKTAYFDKHGAIVTAKQKNLDDSKIPWIKCEENNGDLSHFTSVRGMIAVPNSERNCGPIALHLEHELLKGKNAADIQKHIDANRDHFMANMEKLSVDSRKMIVAADPVALQRNIKAAKNAGFFQPGHKLEFDHAGNSSKKGRFPATTTQGHIIEFEKKNKLTLKRNAKGKLDKIEAGLTSNHRLSDQDVHTIVAHDYNQGMKGKYIEQLLNVFYFEKGHKDKEAALNSLKEYRNHNNDLVTKQIHANRIIKILSEHPGQMSLGNMNQNSSIQEHLDLHAPKNSNNQHSLSPRSRHIATNMLHDNNKDIRDMISKPIKKGDQMMSSQFALGKKQNQHMNNVDLKNASPETKRLLNKIGFHIPESEKKSMLTPTLKRKNNSDVDDLSATSNKKVKELKKTV